MRVVLFHPRFGAPFSQTARTISFANTMPPLGLASIAAVLRKAGIDVCILDAAQNPLISDQTWIDRIISFEPSFVGFTSTTSTFGNAYTVCRRIKELKSSLQTVIGGVHASWGKERLLHDFPAFDYLIAGEGEQSMLSLVKGDPPASIEGLYFRNGSTVEAGPEQTSLCAMDNLPFPAYDLLDGFPQSYQLPLFSYPRQPGATVISSRGCVYQCSYCDRSVFHRSFRWNSPEYTVELITWLNRDFGVRHVHFYDDLFTLDRKRVTRFCSLMREMKPRVTFNCICRIGHIDEELIDLLKSAGCFLVSVGIESGDQAILDKHKAGVSIDTIRHDVTRLHERGIWVKGLFMMGFPGETRESLQKTKELALSLPLKDANITPFTPFPGAPITQEIHDHGSFDADWGKLDCINIVFIPHEIGSLEYLQQYYKGFLSEFYNRPWMRKVYRKMMWESPHSYWRLIKHAGAFLKYARGLKK